MRDFPLASFVSGWAIGVALIVVAVAIAGMVPHTRRLSGALAHSGRPELRMFDLSYGDVEKKMNERSLIAPASLWTYDAAYLQKFARGAAKASLLRDYIEKTLLFWDLILIVGLTTLAAASNVRLATTWHGIPYLSHFAWFCAGMAILYGAADLAENLTLVQLLRPLASDPTAAVPPGSACTANLFTRIKWVALVVAFCPILLFLLSAPMRLLCHGRSG